MGGTFLLVGVAYMGPGGYRFLDYTRVGAPLDLLGWVVAVGLIPLIFPF